MIKQTTLEEIKEVTDSMEAENRLVKYFAVLDKELFEDAGDIKTYETRGCLESALDDIATTEDQTLDFCIYEVSDVIKYVDDYRAEPDRSPSYAEEHGLCRAQLGI